MAGRKVTKRNLPRLVEQHFKDDIKQFSSIHAKMDTLATKDDIKEIVSVFQTAKVGFGLFSLSGRALMWLGGVVAAILAITGAWKPLLVWLGIKQM